MRCSIGVIGLVWRWQKLNIIEDGWLCPMCQNKPLPFHNVLIAPSGHTVAASTLRALFKMSTSIQLLQQYFPSTQEVRYQNRWVERLVNLLPLYGYCCNWDLATCISWSFGQWTGSWWIQSSLIEEIETGMVGVLPSSSTTPFLLNPYTSSISHTLSMK